MKIFLDKIFRKIMNSKNTKYVPPSFRNGAFHCPFCEVYAKQHWKPAGIRDYYVTFIPVNDEFDESNESELWISICDHCRRYAIWYHKEMIYPLETSAPLPVENMPEDVKEDFEEARNIINSSPRAAAALLRLAVQKLVIHLGGEGKNLNEDIGNLVKQGLPEKIQKSLDVVRVIGNNAVHPGEIDLKDDKETAMSLFELINTIVEVMITQPKKIDELYTKLPSKAREAIEKRDRNKKS